MFVFLWLHVISILNFLCRASHQCYDENDVDYSLVPAVVNICRPQNA